MWWKRNKCEHELGKGDESGDYFLGKEYSDLCEWGKDVTVPAAAERGRRPRLGEPRVEIGKQLFGLWARSYWLRRKRIIKRQKKRGT